MPINPFQARRSLSIDRIWPQAALGWIAAISANRKPSFPKSCERPVRIPQRPRFTRKAQKHRRINSFPAGEGAFRLAAHSATHRTFPGKNCSPCAPCWLPGPRCLRGRGLPQQAGEHHRAGGGRQVELISQWQPWKQSTGPKSPDCKARVGHNA